MSSLFLREMVKENIDGLPSGNTTDVFKPLHRLTRYSACKQAYRIIPRLDTMLQTGASLDRTGRSQLMQKLRVTSKEVASDWLRQFKRYTMSRKQGVWSFIGGRLGFPKIVDVRLFNMGVLYTSINIQAPVASSGSGHLRIFLLWKTIDTSMPGWLLLASVASGVMEVIQVCSIICIIMGDQIFGTCSDSSSEPVQTQDSRTPAYNGHLTKAATSLSAGRGSPAGCHSR